MVVAADLQKRIDAFWDKIDRSGGPEACWIWKRCVFTRTGYGQATTIQDLPGSSRSATTTSHRQAWILTYGDPGTYISSHSGESITYRVRHRCPDGPNRLCCNPAHLVLGTDQDNADDRRIDGNTYCGEAVSISKLTAGRVAAVRWLHRNGVACADLARACGVRHSTMASALMRRTWAHVP